MLRITVSPGTSGSFYVEILVVNY